VEERPGVLGRGRRREFAGNVVAVTGGASGLGAAFARRFARSGAKLGLLDLDGEAAKRTAAELEAAGTECLALACDVSDEASCGSAIGAVVRRFGGLDVLVNNAGITHRSAFAETDLAVYRRVMGVNFFGPLHCTKAALPSLLERRGLVVVVSSIAGVAPLYGRTGYAASKHALHGLFGSLRAELAPAGVGILIVCPGFTATGLSRAALDADGSVTRHPQSTVGRIATPESVADAVFDAAARGRRILVLSVAGRAAYVLNRLAPALYEKLMARSLRGELER
jgi:NAD(P)-dependent dehydrogenase (short-subunit alcohol dehydrogenase family)